MNVRVEVPLPVTEVGANDAVTSCGKLEALRFTTPVKPFTAPIVTVLEPLELRFTVMVAGTEMVKSAGGTASTSRLTEVERVSVPSVPVIVSGYVPGGTVLLVVIDRVVVPALLNDEGVNIGVAPAGSPRTVKLTVPA